MTEPRICPECGSDIYRASHYEDLMEARNRHWRKNQEQAIQLLRLQLEVAELKDERRTRGRKVEMQRRTIVRLQEKIRTLGGKPHDDKPLGEGDPTSPSAKHELVPKDQGNQLDDAKWYVNPRGKRKMKKAAKKAKEAKGAD
jgi:hypothetical protein